MLKELKVQRAEVNKKLDNIIKTTQTELNDKYVGKMATYWTFDGQSDIKHKGNIEEVIVFVGTYNSRGYEIDFDFKINNEYVELDFIEEIIDG